jgi:hypothetical protein
LRSELVRKAIYFFSLLCHPKITVGLSLPERPDKITTNNTFYKRFKKKKLFVLIAYFTTKEASFWYFGRRRNKLPS